MTDLYNILKAVLRKLHTRMDSNSDGYVDREELIGKSTG